MKANVNGIELAFTTKGSGRPCFVLSAAGNPIYERTTSDRLLENLEFFFIDLRASGHSTGSAADLSFETVADDLDALREHLGLGPVVVWGHSIHGTFAFDYANRRPESVSHVVAVGAPPLGDLGTILEKRLAFWDADASPSRKEALERSIAAAPPEVIANPFATGAGFIRYYVANGPIYWFDENFDATPLWENHIIIPETVTRLFGEVTRKFDVNELKLNTPVFLANGRYDYSAPFTMWNGVELPTMTKKLYGRSGHYPNWEEAEAFADDFLPWLG